MKKNRTGWNKLKKLVKDRDNSLKFVYMEMLGIPFPMGDTEVHHVRPHGEGGADREENLITLDVWIHRTQFHTSMGHAEPIRQQKALRYLSCDAVKRWREKHWRELDAVYEEIEDERIKRIRSGCLPKKRKGLPF